MHELVRVRKLAALTAVASFGLLGLTALPATAGSGRTATAAQGPPDRSNVGATHSPQVLRELAAPGATAGVTSRLIAPPAGAGPIAGAVQGIDIASHQHDNGPINWADVAADGIQFAAVKATEGAYYPNPYALADLAGATAAGLSVMAYAYAIPNGNGASDSAVTQADYLLTNLGSTGRTVPILLDIEYDPYVSTDGTNECYGLSQSAMVSWISAFSAEVQRKTGRLPIIYTPASWWNTCTGGSTAFGQTPLWVPDYSSAGSPSLPPGWASWAFWQYSSAGTVSGITGPVDLDQLSPGLIPVLNPGNQQTVAGSPADWRLTLADPIAGQLPSFSATGFPAGVSVSASGLVTGWPDRPGTYPVKVTATTGQSASGSASFSWTVGAAPNTGPTGPVRLDLGGKCLTTVAASSSNGTRADIWTCTGGASQRWTVAADATLRIYGKCLNVYHAGTATGTPVNLYTCNGGKAQHWRVGTGGQLVNPASGKCLTDPAGSTANGTRVQLASCSTGRSQKWTLPAGPVASQIPGKCMNDAGNATANGTPVNLAVCNGSTSQAWIAEPDGTVRIHGNCLNTYRSGTPSVTLVDLNTCNGTGTEHWRVVADGAAISLVNSVSGLCLGDPGDTTVNGTQLQGVTCMTTDPGVSWRIR